MCGSVLNKVGKGVDLPWSYEIYFNNLNNLQKDQKSIYPNAYSQQWWLFYQSNVPKFVQYY